MAAGLAHLCVLLQPVATPTLCYKMQEKNVMADKTDNMEKQ